MSSLYTFDVFCQPASLTQLQKPDGQVPCVIQCDVFNMLSATTGDKSD